jgi:hypothetical protein
MGDALLMPSSVAELKFGDSGDQDRHSPHCDPAGDEDDLEPPISELAAS